MDNKTKEEILRTVLEGKVLVLKTCRKNSSKIIAGSILYKEVTNDHILEISKVTASKDFLTYEIRTIPSKYTKFRSTYAKLSINILGICRDYIGELYKMTLNSNKIHYGMNESDILKELFNDVDIDFTLKYWESVEITKEPDEPTKWTSICISNLLNDKVC